MSETKEKCFCFRDCDIYLPDCVLVEILVRLPLKSFFMFKVVSKRWLSLISDSFFSHLYKARINDEFLHSPSKPWTLLCYFFDYKQSEYDRRRVLDSTGDYRVVVNGYPEFTSSGFSLSFLPTKIEDAPIRITASHKGLLLCCQAARNSVSFFVCNPLTKQYVILPKPPNCEDYIDWNAGFIVHDDGSYKVVKILECFRHNGLKFEIFTSDTGTWKQLDVSCPRPLAKKRKDMSFGYSAPLYNGIFHYLEEISGKIIAYDPYRDNHRARLIDLPREADVHGALGVSGGLLCYFDLIENYLDNIQSFKLWVLADYKTGKWKLEHNIKYNDILADDNHLQGLLDRPRFLFLYPRAVHPFDLDIVYFTFLDAELSLNFRTRKMVLVRSGLPFILAHPFILSPWPTVIAQPSW